MKPCHADMLERRGQGSIISIMMTNTITNINVNVRANLRASIRVVVL